MAATLFDEWCRAGLADVVICPGSRSAPLVLAAADRAELRLHVRVDERSAGFFALGRALVTGRPVVVVVTSGTAAAELHAVVAEADLARVPLLVVTADRPPELHGVGAPQTINQTNLYGSMVRRFEEPGVASMEVSASWRSLACRLWRDASGDGGVAGPVHLNAAFVEPLLARASDLPPGREGGVPWEVGVATEMVEAALSLDGKKVLAVVGPGVTPATIEVCRALEWVVLGDATARGSLAYFDPLLRDDEFARIARPDVVIRLGGLPASRILAQRLREWAVRVVALDGAGAVADPDRLVVERVAGLPGTLSGSMRGDPFYAAWWHGLSRRVNEWMRDGDGEDVWLSEPLVARTVVAASTSHDVALVVGSSMPVRDVEWWTPVRTAPTFANRGVNGIDGVVSTVLGVAAGSRALGLVGDVTMLHDVSALVNGLGEAGGCCVLVVADNRGGGIFSFLDQARELAEERFERLFATPHPHDLVAIAQGFGHVAVSVATRGELVAAIEEGLDGAGLTVVVARVPDRRQNVRYHDALILGVRDCWREEEP